MSKVYILGGAQTDFERNWTKEGKTVIALLREVIADALSATKLTYDEIIELNKKNRIAIYVGNFIAEKYINQGHLGALLTEVHPAFYGVPSARYEAACASSSVAICAASTSLQAEVYDVAIVVGWELMKTVSPIVGGDYLGHAAFYEEEGKGIEFPFPKLFGNLADELILKYKLNTNLFMESLAYISNKNYANAKKNPFAQTRNWFMSMEEAHRRGTPTNPFVGGKLAGTDCSQVTDGAAVVILVTERYAQKQNKKLPLLKGFGHRVAPMKFYKKIGESQDSEYILPWTRQAVLDAYKRSSLTIDDIDVFETHDCFTSSEYAAISSFGITAPGEEYRAILDGITSFEGEKPINPSGGLIGGGHPVGASGARMMLDLFRQLTDSAEKYQVPQVRNGMMLNIGGSATTNYVFIIGRDEV